MKTEQKNIFIQYHNADNIKEFPSENLDFNTPIQNIQLDDRTKSEVWIYTRKRNVLKAQGCRCFLIVGKTENKIKNYYLWASFIIEDFVSEFENYIDVKGTGNDFKKPILLNNLVGFQEFKKYCGNFGLGFLNISKSDFVNTLNSFIDSSFQNLDKITNEFHHKLMEINNKMIKINPEKREIEINKLFRNDSKIVELCKKVYQNKCQFPECKSEILTKNGINYVEVAHIRPVRKGGQSIIGNLVVLCPNHHKEFDLGDLKIMEQNEKILIGVLNNKEFKIKFQKLSDKIIFFKKAFKNVLKKIKSLF